MECYPGNRHDSKILLHQLKNFNTVLYNHDRGPQDKTIFMAVKPTGLTRRDPAYDCKKVKIKLKKMGYDSLIPQNKRNIKDPEKIIKMNYNQKKLYKKRLRVENTFNKLKMSRRLMVRYDGKIDAFNGFIYMCLIKILC
jgi:hypothetical protein